MALDHNGLHMLLQLRAEGEPIVVHQSRLAKELGVGRSTINHVIKTMCAEGRLERVNENEDSRRPQLFEVVDYFTWKGRRGEA